MTTASDVKAWAEKTRDAVESVEPVEKRRLITQSQIRTFNKCERLHLHMYTNLYRPARDSDNQARGTFWHRVRKAWWSAKHASERVAAAMNEILMIRSEGQLGESPVDGYLISQLTAMALAYDVRYGELVSSYARVEVETQFVIDLQNPRTGALSRTWQVSGAIDAVVFKHDGTYRLVEEKSTTADVSPGSPYFQRLEIDPQISLYDDACLKTYGKHPEGIDYYVTSWPTLRPLKATPEDKRKYTAKGFLYANQRERDETSNEYCNRIIEDITKDPDSYFQVVEVSRLESEIRESRQDVWDSAKAIRAAEVSGVWRRNPDACISVYGACPFLPVCTHRATLDDPTLYRKAEAAHEELEK